MSVAPDSDEHISLPHKDLIDHKLDQVSRELGLTREKISTPLGKVEVINGLGISFSEAVWPDFLKMQQALLKKHSARKRCLQVSAGAMLHGWADGVLSTYESDETEKLVGSTNHAIAYKNLRTASIGMDFTARDSFTLRESPRAFFILAKDKEHLKEILGAIYGNDGVNDQDKKGWGDLPPHLLRENQENYLYFFGSLWEKVRYGGRLKS